MIVDVLNLMSGLGNLCEGEDHQQRQQCDVQWTSGFGAHESPMFEKYIYHQPSLTRPWAARAERN